MTRESPEGITKSVKEEERSNSFLSPSFPDSGSGGGIPKTSGSTRPNIMQMGATSKTASFHSDFL
jgi:hypothetical protein